MSGVYEHLAVLIHNLFPVSSYAGDAPGSFNSWMRIIGGILFGSGVIWFDFSYMDMTIQDAANFPE